MNVMVLAVREKIQWWSGLALSDDGAWRLHSWGVEKGEVIETTEKKEQYFGIVVPVSFWAKWTVKRHMKWIERIRQN